MSLLFSIALATIPALPEPVANNAVAKVVIHEQAYFLSFMGLGKGKAHHDIHNKVWVLKVGDDSWHAAKEVPSTQPLTGRLASTAVGW